MRPLTLSGVLVGAAFLASASLAAAQPPPPPPTPPATGTTQSPATKEKPKEPIPALTDADRAAAFPPGLDGHAMGSHDINFMVLFDQAEWGATGEGGASWDNRTWIGGDINRLWLRSEGEANDGRVENAFATALVGHSFARWWDVVAGVRQDFRPGAGQTWAAIGIQGLAPYWFEVEATGYVGAGGRTHMRLEVEYELLMTNRLILQPLIEAEVYGKSDRPRGRGAGLTSIETGLRLRYEFRRELAPYVGVTWGRKFFGTADLARASGQEVGGGRLVFGLRTWF